VTAVADSSPLISLARIGHFDLLPKLFERVLISTEVYNEVVVVGAGMPGANQVSHASWIDVVPVRNAAALSLALKETGLGAGELSAVLLARELGADLVLLDECKADAMPPCRKCRSWDASVY
jgi:uncharacterized protein